MMEEGKTYIILLTDGEEVWGTYFGEHRGFWLMKTTMDNKEVIVPVRPSSAALLTECDPDETDNNL